MFHYGIVEDINDPRQLGRARVRVFGIHTYDKSAIPTNTLPWASVIQPTTSAANSGIGQSPRLLNGTLVMLTFADGEDMQMPIVIGTLPSEIQNYVLQINGIQLDRNGFKQGFQDPTNFYPTINANENDLPFPAKDRTYENHQSYRKRVNGRTDDNDNVKIYPTATAAEIDTVAVVSNEALYTGVDWVEPEPAQGKKPSYPNNQVRVSESGITEEWDDSPQTGPRVHNFHPSGTYEEIVSDGSRTIKIVQKNTEIYLNGSDIYINGNVNMTVNGNKRELITGDLVQEVEGDVHQNYHKSVYTKIGEREATEVGLTRTENIGKDETRLIGGNQTETTVGNEYHIVNGTQAVNIKGDSKSVYQANRVNQVANEDNEIINGRKKKFVGGSEENAIVGGRTTAISGRDDLDATSDITVDTNTTISLNRDNGGDWAARLNDTTIDNDTELNGPDAGTINSSSSTVFIGD